MLFDPGNMAIERHVDTRLAASELGPYLRYVQVENIAWRRRHMLLDAGPLDWTETLGALRRAGYQGRLSLDHLGGRPSPATLRRELRALGSA